MARAIAALVDGVPAELISIDDRSNLLPTRRAVRLCESVRPSSRSGSAFAGPRRLNQLRQALGRSEWNDPDGVEGLTCDVEDRVVAIDGCVVTPRVDRCALVGAMTVGCVLGVECPKLGTGRIATRINAALEARLGFPRPH